MNGDIYDVYEAIGVLKKVYDNFPDHKPLVKNNWALLPNGNVCCWDDENACCFCLVGALRRFAIEQQISNELAAKALNKAAQKRGFFDASEYNDDERCEPKHIRALVARAINDLRRGYS